jgi:NADH:ubiquinone oxidoreductase subunit 3 (subunit A)
MDSIITILIILATCVGIYLLGIFLAPKRIKKSEEKFNPFTGGEKLRTLRIRYFSHFFLIIAFFLMFDAIVLLIATGSKSNVYTLVFTCIIFFISVLIGFELRKNL